MIGEIKRALTGKWREYDLEKATPKLYLQKRGPKPGFSHFG
jgi:hypothetical protein